MILDFSRCRLAPFAHQREDVAALIEHPYFFIASECRTGKTKICIDAAQFLHEMGVIDRVIVVAPAPVRAVWCDEEFGELKKHLWIGKHSVVTEFHSRVRAWGHEIHGGGRLSWIVTNYEFIRSKNRVEELIAFCGPRTLLILDESSYIKNYKAAQTVACFEIRRLCGRVVMLNGTPIFHSPLDLFSQGNILHPSVLNCKYVTHYKARYALTEPILERGKPMMRYNRPVTKISGWTNLEDLQRRFAPVTVRRLQAECLDLPPKLDPVVLTATLSKETWRAYKEMRDEMVIWLTQSDVASSATAAVKALRLSQITGGFVGGVEDAAVGEDPVEEGLLDSIMIPGVTHDIDGESWEPIGIKKKEDIEFPINLVATHDTREIGREKLDVLLWLIGHLLEADPNLKIVAWHRFRAEMERALNEVSLVYEQMTTAAICGGQKREERRRALSLLHPDTAPTGPVFVAGTAGTGSFGLDMSAAHTCVTVSDGYSPGRTAQMLDRVYGPRQTHPISYFEIIATGPRGEKTIDHAITAARRAGEDIALWTADAWVKAITRE